MHIENHFAAGAIVNNGQMNVGGGTIKVYQAQAKPCHTIEDFVKAVRKVQSELKITSDDNRMYAAVRVGIDYFGLPDKMSEACKRMEELGIPADYEKVRQVPKTYVALVKPVKEWNAQSMSNNVSAFQKQQKVVSRLSEILDLDL